MRYIGYAFVAVLLYVNYRFSKTSNPTIQKLERLFCHFTILTILSSELLSILELSGVTNGYKLALSILWGVYALYLIIWGFAKDHAYLRIAGIGLFAITLLKLFFYDMADMEAIAKTIVLIILGVLLLVASFVYNKRKKKESSELPIDTNTDEKIS
jgi:LPXTG-motif cell wall-anchored protein